MACDCESGCSCTHTKTFKKMHQLIKELEKRLEDVERSKGK